MDFKIMIIAYFVISFANNLSNFGLILITLNMISRKS